MLVALTTIKGSLSCSAHDYTSGRLLLASLSVEFRNAALRYAKC